MPLALGTSKYLAVREHLFQRIQLLPAGAKLPAEPDLCHEYGVSRITLRHAVDGLIATGWLVREHGRGTFVAAPTSHHEFGEHFGNVIKGFFTQLSEEGLHVRSEVLSQRVIMAGTDIAAHLKLSFVEDVVELIRIRTVDGRVHHRAKTWVPFSRFPDIAELDLTNRSLYQYLREHYGVVLTRNDVQVSITQPDDVLLGALTREEFPASFPSMLTLASTVFDEQERPVAYGTSQFAPGFSTLHFSLLAGPAYARATDTTPTTNNTAVTRKKHS